MPDLPTQTNNSNESGENLRNRDRLAKWVSVLTIWATISIVIGGTVLGIFSDPKDRIQVFQYCVGSLLPLWGTWMGTILAYYFSKENVEAANRTVEYLTKHLTTAEKLETTKSKEAMIPLKEIILYNVDGIEALKAEKLSDLLKFGKEKKINRFVIVDKSGMVLYVIHDSVVNDFIVSENIKNPERKAGELKFEDFLNSEDTRIQDILKNGAQFVDDNSNLSEAQNKISGKTCRDVFVTHSGKKEEPIIGWITDYLLSEKGKV